MPRTGAAVSSVGLYGQGEQDDSDEEFLSQWEDEYAQSTLEVAAVSQAAKGREAGARPAGPVRGAVRVQKPLPKGTQKAPSLPAVRSGRRGDYIRITPQQDVEQPRAASPDPIALPDFREAATLTAPEQQVTDARPSEEAPKKPRTKPVRIKDLIDHNDTSDAAVMEMIMDMPISMPLRVVFAKMPGIAKLLWKPLPQELAEPYRQQKAIVSAALPETNIERIDKPLVVSSVSSLTAAEVMKREEVMGRYRARHSCPKVVVRMGDLQVVALLDSGAEINLIREDVAFAAGLPISSMPPEFRNQSATTVADTSLDFVGFLYEAPVTIGAITVNTPILVVRRMIHKLILGEPYACRASLRTERVPSGRVTCTIISPDGDQTARFVAAQEDTCLLGPEDMEGKE